MKRHDWTETIKGNILFFKLVGFWPEGDSGYKTDFYTLYSISITIAFAFSHSFFQTFQLLTNLNDLDIVAGTAFLAISESLVVVKMFYLARNIPTFKKLLVTLNSDLFQPRSVEQVLLVSPSVEVWKLMYKLMCGSITMVLIFLTLVPIVDKSYKRYRLPLIAWYPYDTKASPFYEITYLHQIISVFFLAISNVNIDTLVAALSMYAGAQLDILCDNLRNLAPESFEENLTKCVHHHREIVRFVQRFNKVFDLIILVQFFASALSLGLTMFLMTVVAPLTNEFYVFLFYGNAVLLEIFVYCWFGNEVQIKSSKILYVAFESNWLEASLVAKKHLIFFMMRAQRITTVSAVNLFDLSLEIFLRILRTSWSYFALMNQLHSDG